MLDHFFPLPSSSSFLDHTRPVVLPPRPPAVLLCCAASSAPPASACTPNLARRPACPPCPRRQPGSATHHPARPPPPPLGPAAPLSATPPARRHSPGQTSPLELTPPTSSPRPVPPHAAARSPRPAPPRPVASSPESEDAVADAVVLSPSRDLPLSAASPLTPETMVDSDDDYFFKNFIDTSSDEKSDDDFLTEAALIIHEHNVSQIPVYRGSLPGRAAALERKRERDHDQLFTDYFQPKALFTPAMFRRRFRMSRPLFRRIMDGVKVYDDYFCAKVDAIGKVGLSSYQKCTAAIRMFAYDVAGDFVDEYTRMSESTCLEVMYRFYRSVIGAYIGHSEWCTVILEAVASHDTWIWHSFFGMAGSHNDINVLQRSPLFDRLVYGQSPDVDFEINGHHYNKGTTF
ncbi:hypothetical protein QYE76_029569 [Lolium multiflorum]|uniref:Uncharacterized protein n=1 Tax=Lolium multiflorum TaxID=4521 RepID=A0AAD8QN24_LOLMU|nr:hypothetical protein QYE76_029569 [Lolium multiflorum]